MVYLHNETAETITGHKIGENGSSVIAQKAEFAVFHNGKFYTVEYSGGNYRNYFITEVDPLTNETRSIGSYSSSSHIENQYDIDVAGDYIFMRQPGGFTNVHKISTGERSGYPILP